MSFIAAIGCLILLYFSIDEQGLKSTISASLAASSFFFASMGVVLIAIGKSNLPSFKVGKTDV